MHTEQPPDNDGFRQVIENKIVWWVIFYSRCNNLKLRRNQISMLLDFWLCYNYVLSLSHHIKIFAVIDSSMNESINHFFSK